MSATTLTPSATPSKIAMGATGRVLPEPATVNYDEVLYPLAVVLQASTGLELTDDPNGRTAGTWDQVAQEESEAADAAIKRDEKEAWRMFAPFALLVCLVLLSLWYWLSSATPAATEPHLSPQRADGAGAAGHGRPACAHHEGLYTVRPGDTCWALAERHGYVWPR